MLDADVMLVQVCKNKKIKITVWPDGGPKSKSRKTEVLR